MVFILTIFYPYGPRPGNKCRCISMIISLESVSRSWIAGPKGLHMLKAFDVCQIALLGAILIYIPTNSVGMLHISPNPGQLCVLSYF